VVKLVLVLPRSSDKENSREKSIKAAGQEVQSTNLQKLSPLAFGEIRKHSKALLHY
jgi:hypothetical protein